MISINSLEYIFGNSDFTLSLVFSNRDRIFFILLIVFREVRSTASSINSIQFSQSFLLVTSIKDL